MKYHGNVIEKYLHENYQIRVDIDEHGWEGVLLYHEEIEDEYGNEWLFALATQPDDVNHLLYATCFKNNERFTVWVPEK